MYSIQDVYNKTGLTAHTLRYYEKIGLLAAVERTKGGFRQYTDADLEALWLICCLKNTGMSLQEIGRFVNLAGKGDRTLRERVALLKAHRENVLERMRQIQSYLDKVTWKIDFYTEKLHTYETQEMNKETDAEKS